MGTKSESSEEASRRELSASSTRIGFDHDHDHDHDLESQKSVMTSEELNKSPPALGKKRSCTPNARTVSDAILGLSDGLTVPFALTAGLSVLGDTKLVQLGGLAELMAGAISMGLGGFVGAKSEEESYQATMRDTEDLIRCSPNQTSTMVRKVFEQYSLPESTVAAIVTDLHHTPQKLSSFLMSFHHQLVAPASSRAYISASTLGIAYFAGGFIPLIPYFCVKRNEVLVALYWSIGIMAVTLLAFGYLKTGFVRGWRGRQNVRACITGGIQMLLVGGIAAGAAIGLVRAINAHTTIKT